jgi:hypothetical protein
LLLFTGEPDITKVLFDALDVRAVAAMGIRAGAAAAGEDTGVYEGGKLIDGADWRAINGNSYPIEVLAIEGLACISSSPKPGQRRVDGTTISRTVLTDTARGRLPVSQL